MPDPAPRLDTAASGTRAAVRLRLRFAPEGLAEDLARLCAAPWTPHFNTDLYHGDWRGIALRAPAGAAHAIDALHNAPGCERFVDQPLFARCPHLKAAVDSLACEVTAVRLLRLAPGARIAEHRDHALGEAYGELRLHLPVVTNPEVDFRVLGVRVCMRPGELWYVDASEPHAVSNTGATARVHLVIDCRHNDWLAAQLSQGEVWVSAGPAPPSVPATAPGGGAKCVHGGDDLTAQIVAFLREIGLHVSLCALPETTFLPGIAIEAGGLRVDPARLCHPGDLLHEAGHLAVMPPEDRHRQGARVSNDPAQEMMAIAWSWAAVTHLGLAPAVVFHAGAYRGDAQWLIDTYSAGTFIALPMLQWVGMTADPARAEALGIAPYPHMRRWLRDTAGTPDDGAAA